MSDDMSYERFQIHLEGEPPVELPTVLKVSLKRGSSDAVDLWINGVVVLSISTRGRISLWNRDNIPSLGLRAVCSSQLGLLEEVQGDTKV